MRVKNILSVIAFIAGFGLSVLLVGVPQNNFYSKYRKSQDTRNARQNITILLRQDIENGYLKNQRITYLEEQADRSRTRIDLSAYSEATTEYVEASESLSLNGLPADFRAAWVEHMNAWRQYADSLERQKENGVKYTVNGREIVQYPVHRTSEDFYRSQVEEINATWYEVLRIGRKYGAYVNEY